MSLLPNEIVFFPACRLDLEVGNEGAFNMWVSGDKDFDNLRRFIE